MSAEIMVRGAVAPLAFTEEQQRMIRDSFASGASPEAFAMLMEVAKARGLNPLLKQVHFVERWDKAKGRMVWSTQVSIDGMRAIAERTGLYAGQDEPEFIDGPNGSPTVCKVRVYRKDWTRPAVGVAYFSEYVQTTKEGKPASFWQRMPHTMLAKCAESLALRKAFPEDTSGLYTPEDTSGLYTPEEMGQADNDAAPAVVQQHTPSLAALGIEQRPTLSAPSTWAADLAACSTLRSVRACYQSAASPEADTRAMCDDVRAWCAERGVIATAAEVMAILATLPEAALVILDDIHADEEREPVSRIEHVARRVAKARGEWDAHSAETVAKIVARSYAHAAGVDLRTAGATLKRLVTSDEPEPTERAPDDVVSAADLARINSKNTNPALINSVRKHAAEILASPALAHAYAGQWAHIHEMNGDPRSIAEIADDAAAKVRALATAAAQTVATEVMA